MSEAWPGIQESALQIPAPGEFDADSPQTVFRETIIVSKQGHQSQTIGIQITVPSISVYVALYTLGDLTESQFCNV